MGYMCDSNDDQPATWLVQKIDEGEILTLCDAHYVAYVQEVYLSLVDQLVTPAEPGATDPITGDDTDEDEHADECRVCGVRIPDSECEAHYLAEHVNMRADQLVSVPDADGAQGGGTTDEL